MIVQLKVQENATTSKYKSTSDVVVKTIYFDPIAITQNSIE